MLSGRGFQITPLLAFIRAGALPSCSALLHQDSRQEYAGAFLVPADSISFVCMLPPENGSFPSSRMDAGYSQRVRAACIQRSGIARRAKDRTSTRCDSVANRTKHYDLIVAPQDPSPSLVEVVIK